jgi:DNA invertase Pin-like site-specific DNA recombinase
MLIGYVRVSTNEQNTALQRDALQRSGCELIFEDKISGKSTNRPGLNRASDNLMRAILSLYGNLIGSGAVCATLFQ